MNQNQSPEKYAGYAKQFQTPKGKVGMQVRITARHLEELYRACSQAMLAPKEDHPGIDLLILPVKPENVTQWRTHSVKFGTAENLKPIVDEH